MKPNQIVMDIECYTNYFLVMFRNSQGKSRYFELYEDHPLDVNAIKTILSVAETITFNGNNYDMPMLALAMSGADNLTLKQASDSIITEDLRPWDFYRRYKLQQPNWNHIDLIEPAPAVKISLKLYGGRMHSKRLQDLPIEPNELITPEQRTTLIEYCKNDLQTTVDLYHAIEDRIDLRRAMTSEYNLDLRSKSDAQIAEAVIKQEVEKITGRKIKKQGVKKQVFKYEPPSFVKFRSVDLNNILEYFKNVDFIAESNGTITLSEEPSIATINKTNYKLGMGGLHSQESEKYHLATDNIAIQDWDVASYYPNIILQLGLYPQALGPEFIEVFRSITETRLKAKREGNKLVDSSMKIMINGTFGKLGSAYSVLYAPHLLIQTTVTGQLALLMLIERLEENGIQCVSGNTDGIVLKFERNKEPLLKAIVKAWETHTGFTMESTEYKAIYSRDVNSYIAIKTDNKVKTKGFFATGGLSKSPTNEICTQAFIEYLQNNTPIEQTIRNEYDIRKFLSIRTVKGGAVKDDKYLGKAIRWAYGVNEPGTINYKSNGNTVPRSEGAIPVMTLPDDYSVPVWLDREWYIREAKDMLMDVGLVKRPKPAKIPRKNCKAWQELVDKGYLIQSGETYIWYTESDNSI